MDQTTSTPTQIDTHSNNYYVKSYIGYISIPTACWHQLHPRFHVSQQGKCLRYPPEHMGGVKKCKIRQQRGGWAPFEPPH